jgi:CheY-like chemotaxis protein
VLFIAERQTNSFLQDLFQEFEQVVDEDVNFMSGSSTPSTSEASSGTLGIGLAVVARYVRNMKGQIRVQSEPGKGTLFCLELPFELAKASPDVPRSRRQSIMDIKLTRGMSDVSLTDYTTERQQSIDEKTHMGMEGTSPTSTFHSPRNAQNILESPDIERFGIGSSSTIDSTSSNYPFPQMDGATTSPTRPHLSVLIAEDNPIKSRILTRRLEKLGYEVQVAIDGQECHDYFKLHSQQVDVILMDIQVCSVPSLMIKH